MGSNAVMRPSINDIDIQNLIKLRQERESQKKHLADLEDGIKSLEAAFIKILQKGGQVKSQRTLEIKSTERRYPAWKEHFIEVCGKEKADEVLNQTEPKVHLSLIIK